MNATLIARQSSSRDERDPATQFQHAEAYADRSLMTKLEAAEGSANRNDQANESGVAEALMRLSEKDREAITLVAWEGLSPNEAAVVVGQSPVAFRVRLHRAKGRLREKLGAQAEAQERAHNVSPGEIPLTGGGPER